MVRAITAKLALQIKQEEDFTRLRMLLVLAPSQAQALTQKQPKESISSPPGGGSPREATKGTHGLQRGGREGRTKGQRAGRVPGSLGTQPAGQTNLASESEGEVHASRETDGTESRTELPV